MQVLLAPLLELGNGKNVKDVIILSLSHEWPLTVRKLHNAIEKRGMSVSYHAVHKACQQLISQGILKREKIGYMISMDWIEHVSSLLEGMKKNYIYNRPMLLPSLKDFKSEGDTRTFVFENLAEADAYRKRLQQEYGLEDGQKKPYISTSMHLRSPLLYSEKSFRLATLANKMKIDCYLLVGGSTPVDEWCADYYRMQSHFVRTGVRCSDACDIGVLGNVIVQLYLPEKVRQNIEQAFNVKDISGINVPEFYRQIYLAPAEARLVVSYNSELAEQLRQQVLSQFERRESAIFDVDESFVSPGVLCDIAKKLFDEKAGADVVRLVERFERGALSGEKFLQQYPKLWARALRGRNSEEVKGMIRALLRDNISSNRIWQHSARLFHLVRSYYMPVAVSAMPAEIIQASDFSFDAILTSEAEVVGGKYTGRLQKDLGGPDAKKAAVEKWLSGRPAIGFGRGKWMKGLVTVLMAANKSHGFAYDGANLNKMFAGLRSVADGKRQAV
jgi:phosphoserine phosphatase